MFGEGGRLEVGEERAGCRRNLMKGRMGGGGVRITRGEEPL